MATALAQNFPQGAWIFQARIAAVAAGADQEIVLGFGLKKCQILSAGFIPDTAITGANTDSRDFSFVNKGSAGDGTTAIKAAKHYVNGVDVAAYVADELITASDAKTIAENEVVTFKSLHVGSTGMADVAGLAYMVLWPL